MIRQVANIFSIPELRKRILVTLGLLIVYRLGMYVPIPGTGPEFIRQFAAERSGMGGAESYLSFISTITGGSMLPFLFCLGIMPYISASIVLQLLTTVIPSLEKLAKEGDAGRKKMQEYTRYLTVLLCIVQGAVIISNGVGGAATWLAGSDVNRTLYFIIALVSITTGTVFLMWLGEQIDEFGIGNGVSLIIMAGIVDRLPGIVLNLMQSASWSLTDTASGGVSLGVVILLGLMFVGIVFGTVMITQGQRRIPIQQARQIRGRRVYGAMQRQYLPLKVNQAGVIPVIFASSLMMIPAWVFGALDKWLNWGVTRELQVAFNANEGAIPYIIFYIVLIIVFCYFWVAIQFQPNEMANNLRDYGHFVPGMRPGSRTAEYLEKVMNRITYVGAAFLAGIAIIPLLLSKATNVSMMVTGFLGGTGLLIVVSVALDVVQRIESHLIMRHYEGFLSSGRVKGRQR
ncbi:MAG TPA: preprotein translocase subunit SecY [Phycisphaerae bacterium]|nr:preprotein translocase subunit SecY [Phycisphaerae bacterium]HOI54050.1 preprotein translocase subunit SecY [Phycisphaerae bacterium]